MNNFYKLPTVLQEYIHVFKPDHRTNLEKVHEDLFADFHYHSLSFVHEEFEELVMSEAYECDYEYCQETVSRADAVEGTSYLPPQVNWTRQFHFCNEDCKSAGMCWIQDDYNKSLRRMGF
jgi:hypothetical protein